MRRAAFFAILLQFALAQELPVFRADADLVTIPCVVTNRHGEPVRNLKAADFRVYDNGAPQEIRNLWRETDLPLTLGIIVDISNSQRGMVREHQTTVRHFLEHLIHPRDRAFVVEVNDKVILRSEMTGSPNGLSQRLLHRYGEELGEPCAALRGRSLCGGTALWNAIYAAAHLKFAPASGSKALIILSDGEDTGSTPHHFDDALHEVEEAGAVAYVIQYPDPLGRRLDNAPQPENNLARLVDATGGTLFDPPGIEYGQILVKIEDDLRSQYVIGFRPDPAASKPGARHELKVEVKRPGVTVRARQEYAVPSR